jgi:signal transduction histidine kinase
VVLPWYLETRLILIVTAGLVVCLFFGGLAINRHLKLKRSYAEVERIVKQRTGELNQAHEALLHSQKMQALGTLSAGIAHDFNNILSIIQGSVQIIAEHLDDKNRVMTRLDRIKTMVEQGASIVKAMLGYSRTQPSEATACDINQVVEETIKLLGDRFLEGIVLDRQLKPGLPSVFCVKELLQQMLLNLILNASEAMAGEGKIVLLTSSSKAFPANSELPPKAANEYVVVAVQDAGCGINAEIRSRIFEPFFTTKALSTRRGTGLGLSMVYEFARTQGLGIHLASEVGRGSVFTLYLPIGLAAPAKASS